MRKMYNTKRLLGTVACAAAILAAPALGQDAGEEIDLFGDQEQTTSDQKVEVGTTGEIDLHVKELEITKVLQLLSIQSRRNIIASRGVENIKVSADLYGVSFEEALESILKPNKFGYTEQGNFIYVMTEEEIAERESASRKLTTKIYRLDYLRADEAAAFVTPMLSDAGAITASANVADGFDPGVDNAGSNQYAGPATLVIRDYEDSVQEVVAVLDELDLEPVNVIIEATVLRSNLTENNQFGVDFSLFTDLTGASPLNIIDNAISGGNPNPNKNFGAAESRVGYDSNSAVKLGFVAGDAAVFVSALDSVTDTTIVATPKVTVLDRTATKILVGEKIAYLSTTVTETSETQTVEFLEVGTQLNVRPFVSSDGKIRLELRPSVSDATIRAIGDTDAPDQITTELVTNVIVESGQTIVLGGLITDDTSITRSQVPGLGSIPIIGAAFKGHKDVVGKSEVIFLVKATVVGHDTLQALGKEGTKRIDVARLAEREQLLPWSRSKLTSAHMLNARRYYEEALTLTGEARDAKMADALYCVDMALHMNPSMVDALMLKEQITGKAAYTTYDESLLRDTYDSVLDQEIKALNVPEMPAPAQPEALEVEQPIEPEPLTEVPTDAFEGDEPAADAGTAAQADADDAWLEKMLAEQFDTTTTQPQPHDAPAEAAETPADETTEVAQDQPTEDGPATEETPAQPEVTEVPTNDTEDFSVNGQGQAQPQSTEVFGFDWRSLSTAQLLQMAAEAAGQAQAGRGTENSTADAPTTTD